MRITAIFLVGFVALSLGGCEYLRSQGQNDANKNETNLTPSESTNGPAVPRGLGSQCGQPGVWCPRPVDPPPGNCEDEYGYSTCSGGSAFNPCKDGSCPTERQKPETEEDFKYSLPPRKS